MRRWLQRQVPEWSEVAWDELRRTRWVDEVIQTDGDPDTLQGLLDEYHSVLNALRRYAEEEATGPRRVRRKTKRKFKKVLPPDQRLIALAEMAAIDAGRDGSVRRFRKEVLGDRLLAPEEVEGWVKEQALRDGPEQLIVTVEFAVPLEQLDDERFLTVRDLPRIVDIGKAVTLTERLEALMYRTGDNRPDFVRIRPGGTLWRLKSIAVMLSQHYSWKEWDAVFFVLTGIPPDYPKAHISLTWRRGQPRIVMDLDPRLSRTDVARLYAEARSSVWKGTDRPLEEKTRRLAVFLHENFDDKKTWRELTALWNRKHPEWSYEREQHFARDAVAAWQRVTGLPWLHQRKGGRPRAKKEGTR